MVFLDFEDEISTKYLLRQLSLLSTTSIIRETSATGNLVKIGVLFRSEEVKTEKNQIKSN